MSCRTLPVLRCRHCGDPLSPARTVCPLCRRTLGPECPVCHAELAHDVIVNQNIHLCGNPVSGSGPDGDPDAWAKADQID